MGVENADSGGSGGYAPVKRLGWHLNAVGDHVGAVKLVGGGRRPAGMVVGLSLLAFSAAELGGLSGHKTVHHRRSGGTELQVMIP